VPQPDLDLLRVRPARNRLLAQVCRSACHPIHSTPAFLAAGLRTRRRKVLGAMRCAAESREDRVLVEGVGRSEAVPAERGHHLLGDRRVASAEPGPRAVHAPLIDALADQDAGALEVDVPPAERDRLADAQSRRRDAVDDKPLPALGDLPDEALKLLRGEALACSSIGSSPPVERWDGKRRPAAGLWRISPSSTAVARSALSGATTLRTDAGARFFSVARCTANASTSRGSISERRRRPKNGTARRSRSRRYSRRVSGRRPEPVRPV